MDKAATTTPIRRLRKLPPTKVDELVDDTAKELDPTFVVEVVAVVDAWIKA
jgi:hypothetical protein